MAGSHISLFAGIGATDIAAEKAGFKTIATAEIDPFCRRVLQARFPTAAHYEAVQHLHVSDFKHSPDLRRPLLISGGFPCQGVASAGTGLGLADPRSGLWSEFIRVIREFQPDYVLIENSPLLRSRGMDTVLIDLAQAGYDAEWDCIPAAAMGAPHLRDRVFITAKPSRPGSPTYGDIFGYCDGHSLGVLTDDGKTRLRKMPRAGYMVSGDIVAQDPQYPVNYARTIPTLPLVPTPTKSDGSGGPGTTPRRAGGRNLRTHVMQVLGESSGRLSPLWVEWLMGLPFGWTRPPYPAMFGHAGWYVDPIARTVPKGYPDRGKRIQALGNSLVWHCAYEALQNGGVTC